MFWAGEDEDNTLQWDEFPKRLELTSVPCGIPLTPCPILVCFALQVTNQCLSGALEPLGSVVSVTVWGCNTIKDYHNRKVKDFVCSGR